MFSYLKINPDGFTKPRTELFPTTMNTNTGEIVKKTFQSNHKEKLKLCGSQVTLFQINNQDKPVKQLVWNAIVERNRITQLSE